MRWVRSQQSVFALVLVCVLCSRDSLIFLSFQIKKRPAVYQDKIVDLNNSDSSKPQGNVLEYITAFLAHSQGAGQPSTEQPISNRMARRAKKQQVVYDDVEAGRVLFRYPMEEGAQVLTAHYSIVYFTASLLSFSIACSFSV
jgi:hypothetical protein